MSNQQLLERITCKPEVMVGKPVVKGTRLTVEHILNLLAHGSSVEEILDEYDGLTPEDVRACLLYASQLVAKSAQMRFLVDECTGPAVARWLRSQSHQVFSVYDEARGSADDNILEKATSENWIRITNDKDFGEKVYRDKQPHCDIVFLRLEDERAAMKIEAMKKLIDEYGERLADAFVVVTEQQVRFGQA